MALPYVYYPEIKLGFFTIYTFGLLTAIAFLAGLWLVLKEAKRRGMNKDVAEGLVFYIILGGILGSRILHIILFWQSYYDNPLTVFKFWQGGLVFYGGFLGAVLAAWIYVKIKKLNFLEYLDLVAPSTALGHAIGRVGCLIGDGGHVGKLTSLPFGVIVDGELRHLTALYDFINLTVLFIILLQLRKKRFFTGFVFFFYMAFYAFVRFFLEFLRTDPTFYGLTITQWFAIPLFGVSLVMIFKKW
ncbi:prolipoprotein diacylglyceryl transferase [Candidatus Woesearchaeota archaeon]|nr:prolipoprotein diacylglyceryl transferase [Candidatus Woesearchaeota archaeon]